MTTSSHAPYCRREVDIFGRWWHTAICETVAENMIYAAQMARDQQIAEFDATQPMRYAAAIAELLGAASPR